VLLVRRWSGGAADAPLIGHAVGPMDEEQDVPVAASALRGHQQRGDAFFFNTRWLFVSVAAA